MKVQVLGSGCRKCGILEEHARAAVAETGIDAVVEKITDLQAIVAMGVMSTPALAIDGAVKSSGRVLTKEQVIALLQAAGRSA